MVVKKKSIKEQMNEDIPINIMTVDKKEIKPFLPKGHIFIKEEKSRWIINFDKIPEIIMEFYREYENWFNSTFNNDTHFLAIEELDTFSENLEIFESDK